MGKKFKSGIASYPQGFLRYVVSPEKICLQFDRPEVKIRPKKEYADELFKLPSCELSLPIERQGNEVGVLAVGLQFPILQETQMQMVEAYKEHLEKYPGVLNEFIHELCTQLQKLL